MLDKIVKTRRESVAQKKNLVPAAALHRRDGDVPRSFFRKALDYYLITECKKASPSAGVIAEQYDPASIAAAYYDGGAGAVSVLTEPLFFNGSDADLKAVRAAVPLPVLRKDFIVDLYQVQESYALGADIILLIAAVLKPEQAADMAAFAHELGMEVLLECHSRYEIEAFTKVEADAIGINARNLGDFSVSLELARDLLAFVPEGRVAVAESGMKSTADVRVQADAGFSGFLVGEFCMRAENPAELVRSIRNVLEDR